MLPIHKTGKTHTSFNDKLKLKFNDTNHNFTLHYHIHKWSDRRGFNPVTRLHAKMKVIVLSSAFLDPPKLFDPLPIAKVLY